MEDRKKAYRIIKVTRELKGHPANIIDDFSLINDADLNTKKQHKMSEWVADKVKTTYIRFDYDYNKCDILKKWKK